MNQKDRIEYYENILDEGTSILEELTSSIEKFKSYQEKIDELEKYFESQERMKDVEDDQNNLLPQDLKTGVLAEDYLYDLLTTWDELKKIIDKY